MRKERNKDDPDNIRSWMLPGRSLEYRCDCSTVQLMSPVVYWVVTLKVAVIRTGTLVLPVMSYLALSP